MNTTHGKTGVINRISGMHILEPQCPLLLLQLNSFMVDVNVFALSFGLASGMHMAEFFYSLDLIRLYIASVSSMVHVGHSTSDMSWLSNVKLSC